MSRRISYVDNLKALLIIFVVVGHFVEACLEDSGVSKGIFLFIYSFHMPLFIFVTGLTCKSIIEDPRRTAEKALYYLVLFFIMKFLIYVLKIAFHKKTSFSLLVESGIPWYLLAVSVYYTAAHILKNFQKKSLLLLSVILGLICGYDKTVGDFLALSRILVYAPCFILGWMFDIKKFEKLSSLTYKIGGILFIGIWGIICIAYVDKIYFLRPLFTGRNSYFALGENIHWGGYFIAQLHIS